MENRPLYVDFANSVLANRHAELMSLEEEKRKEAVLSVFRQASTMPELNIKSEVKPERIEQARKQTAEGKGQFQRFGTTERAKSEGARNTREIELMKSGVDIDRDLPAGDWKLGYGVNPIADVKKVLSDSFETNVSVFKSGDDLIYIDPKEQRPVKVNLNLPAKAGHALPIFGDIAGTVVGKTPAGFVGKAVLKETVGSGSGAALGELIRLTIGGAVGMHDLSPEEVAKQAALVGGEASLWTGGVGSAVALGKGIKNMRQGHIFTKDEALNMGFSSEEADKVVSEINEIIKRGKTDKELKSTLYQKTGDVNIGARQAQIERRSEFAKEFAERETSDKAAAREAVEVVSKPGVEPYVGKESVGDIAADRVSKRVEQGKQIVDQNTLELDRQLDSMSKVQKESVGEPTLIYIQAKKQAAYDAEQRAWNGVKETGGFNSGTGRYGINITEGKNTTKLKQKYKQMANESWTKSSRQDYTSVYIDGEKKSVSDLANLNRELSGRRTQKRMAARNPNAMQQVRELGEVITAMEGDRSLALIKAGKADLLQKIQEAEGKTLLYNTKYKRSVAGDLMKVNDAGVPVIKSEDFVENMLKRDKAEIDEFLDIIGDNPELKSLWKEGLANAYRQKSFSGNRYKRDIGRNWIESKRPVLERFFTKAEISAFGKTGYLAEKVTRQTDKLKKFKMNANKRWGSGSLASVDPEGLTKFITEKGGSWATPGGRGVQTRIAKIKAVKNITKTEPAAWQTVKNEFKQAIRNDIIDLKTGNINPTRLAKWAEDVGNKAVVIEMMGGKYYSDLVKINKAVQMISMQTASLTADESHKAGIQAIRAAVAPPLTRRGRAFTAALTWDSARSHKVMADAILDEKTMSKVAELGEHSAWTRIFFEKMASAGFALPTAEFNE